MSRDPLRALARLRALAVDHARRDLAARLRAEGAALGELDAARAELRAEAAAATGAPPELAGAYALWLPFGRQSVTEATGRLSAAQQAATAAQADVAAARAAARAVDALRDRHADEAAKLRLRAEQAALDEFGVRRP